MRDKGWTAEQALAAGADFVRTEQRRPNANDTRGDTPLPDQGTLRKLFGSVANWQALLPDPPPTPKIRPRRCLMCEHVFQPVHQGLHICEMCKRTEEYQEDTTWMNGMVS